MAIIGSCGINIAKIAACGYSYVMFLENIQLLRMHRMKPDPNTQGQSHDSIQIRGGANALVGQPLQPSPSNKPAVPANLPSSALRRP